MKSPPTVTELELSEVERALDFVEEQLGEEAVRPLRLLFTWVLSIRVLLQEKTLNLKRLRRLVFGSCGTCGKVQTAELPEEAGTEKCDPSVAATIATLRYGEGLPWSRLERLQSAAGIPLPVSVQCELTQRALERGLGSVYHQLLWEAAQGGLMHNDDTPMKVLELTGLSKQGLPLREDAPERTGVFTTGILSLSDQRPTIVLFFTGPFHAGENLRTLLEQRLEELMVRIPADGEYSVWVRALVGGEHPDRALAVEVASRRFEATHGGEGPGDGAFTWERAGSIRLPAGAVELKIHPVGKRHPAADAILLTPDAHWKPDASLPLKP